MVPEKRWRYSRTTALFAESNNWSLPSRWQVKRYKFFKTAFMRFLSMIDSTVENYWESIQSQTPPMKRVCTCTIVCVFNIFVNPHWTVPLPSASGRRTAVIPGADSASATDSPANKCNLSWQVSAERRQRRRGGPRRRAVTLSHPAGAKQTEGSDRDAQLQKNTWSFIRWRTACPDSFVLSQILFSFYVHTRVGQNSEYCHCSTQTLNVQIHCFSGTENTALF